MTAQPPEPPSDRPADSGGAPPPPPPPPGGPGGYGGQSSYGGPSYQAAPPPSSYGGVTGPQPAGLLERFLARLIDGILLAIVNVIISTVFVVGMLMDEDGGTMFNPGADYGVSAVAALIGVAINMAYFTFMESSQGRTVGKMLLKLRTEGPSGGNPTVEQAFKRNIFNAIGLIGLIPVVGAFISPILSLIAVIAIAVQISNDTVNRQGWHDRFADGTRVLKVG